MVQLIPISDANPTRRFPLVTIALIALNVVAFFQTPGLGTSADSTLYFFENAPVSCQLNDGCPEGVFLSPGEIEPCNTACMAAFGGGGAGGIAVDIPDRDLFSFLRASLFSTFLHAGFLHIAGNLLFLWVFGNNVEDFLGPVKYVAFYLLGGITASLAHTVTHLDSIVPSVGASGAVAAVMGAYLVLFPRARVNVLVPIFILWTIIQMSAWVVLGLWFLYQFLIGAQELSGATEVAWMAHVGGFVYGFIAIVLLGGRPHRPRYAMWERGWR